MKQYFKTHHGRLYIRAVLTGILSGLVVTAYRVLLGKINSVTAAVSSAVREQPWYLVLLLAAFAACALFVGWLTEKYPMIKGSGIPQVKGVLKGFFSFRWLPEICAKFAGGLISLGCGLSLGREGPSIQLGAYVSCAVSEKTLDDKKGRLYLMTAGAASGLASAFNAPLAGIMFAFEELRRSFSHTVLGCVILSCISAEVVSELFLGQATVFSFPSLKTLPVYYYLLLLPLGAVCGIISALFNTSLTASQTLHAKIKNGLLRPLPAFLTAGLLFFLYPSLLGSGQDLLTGAQAGSFSIVLLVVLVFGKLLYTALSYGSGAPGGIFFPLLVLGALIGICYNSVLVQVFSFSDSFGTLFIVLGMTAFFSGVTRAPITGCILISEMAGSLSHLIPLIIVSLVSYGIAKYFGAEPIYDELLDRMLADRKEPEILPS